MDFSENNMPSVIYVLSTEMTMDWPKWKESFVLLKCEFSEDLDGYTPVDAIYDENLPTAGSPEEFLLKAEILDYTPCFKCFNGGSERSVIKKDAVLNALRSHDENQ